MHTKFAYFKVSWELFHKIRREELFLNNSLNYNQIRHVFFNLIRFVVKNMKSSGRNFHDKQDWICSLIFRGLSPLPFPVLLRYDLKFCFWNKSEISEIGKISYLVKNN